MTPVSSRDSLVVLPCAMSASLVIPIDQRAVEDAAYAGKRRLFADQQAYLGLLENITQALVGMRRVERHIGRARFEAGEQCDDRPFGTFKAEADDGAGTKAQAAQMMGQTIGLRLYGIHS